MIFDKTEAAAVGILVAAIIGLCGYSVILQKRLAAETEERQTQTARAAMCAEAVRGLEEEAIKRQEEARAIVEAAREEAQEANRRADEILKRPAAVPGDDCKSAQIRAQAWLRSRKQ